ncbi:protein Mis18-alpha-like isoform X3 [Rhinoderma darwinii]|uniref:protein Mis18-alpha-like isoform X3 n=1 Tax=Rhinoderma darwinii TaxID=43563 RepID=UPI003F67EF38
MAEAEISNAVTENPVLVLCSSCRVPLADSGDLVETPEGANVILVKAVTADVEIDEEKVVSTYEQDVFSTLQVLYCKGCNSPIGALYVSTPRHLDYKRDLFNLDPRAVNCAEQCLASVRDQ